MTVRAAYLEVIDLTPADAAAVRARAYALGAERARRLGQDVTTAAPDWRILEGRDYVVRRWR